MLLDINLCEFLDLIIDSHVKFEHIIRFNLITLLDYDASVIIFGVGDSVKCVNTVDAIGLDAIERVLNTNFVANVWILESLQGDNHIVDELLNILR